MWSEPRDAAYVYEMLESIALIERLVVGREKQAFLADQSLPHALALHFLVLGETASKLSKGFKAAVPSIEWQRIINLRHLIAHEYRRIDHAELWRITFVELPKLKSALPELPAPGDIY